MYTVVIHVFQEVRGIMSAFKVMLYGEVQVSEAAERESYNALIQMIIANEERGYPDHWTEKCGSKLSR